MANKIEANEFEGWVEKIFPEGEYDCKFVVANYRDAEHKSKMAEEKQFPIALQFSASTKSGASAPLCDVEAGDYVKVKYYISGKSGISKKTGNYYCINTLNVAKTDGIAIIKKASSRPHLPQSVDDDSIPF